MPELPEVEVVQEVLNRQVVGQTIAAAVVVQPGGAIVVRDLTGLGFGPALTGGVFESVARRGKFLFLRSTNGRPVEQSAQAAFGR